MDKNFFAEELRGYMQARRVRVGELAQITGIAQPQISQYLRRARRPGPENVEAMAKALNWPLQDALHAAGYHRPGLEIKATDIGTQLSDILERLDPSDQQALVLHLREVAQSWVSSIKRAGMNLNPLLRRANSYQLYEPTIASD